MEIICELFIKKTQPLKVEIKIFTTLLILLNAFELNSILPT